MRHLMSPLDFSVEELETLLNLALLKIYYNIDNQILLSNKI